MTHHSRFSRAVSSKRRFTCSHSVWISMMSTLLSGRRWSRCSACLDRVPLEHPISEHKVPDRRRVDQHALFYCPPIQRSPTDVTKATRIWDLHGPRDFRKMRRSVDHVVARICCGVALSGYGAARDSFPQNRNTDIESTPTTPGSRKAHVATL